MDREQMQAHLILQGWRLAQTAAAATAGNGQCLVWIRSGEAQSTYLPALPPPGISAKWSEIPEQEFWRIAEQCCKIYNQGLT